MSPMWTDLRRAPMWRIALGASLVAVALSLLMPEGPGSAAGIAVAALGFMAFALVLVALKGADAWTLLGLLLVLGAVLSSTDLAIGPASVLYVVMVTAATHALSTLRPAGGRPARRAMLHR
jgi:hypothetical protein